MAIIVGIGGVSRAGKTFLAGKISQNCPAFRSIILPQDDFVKPIDEIPLIHGHIDWESPESINFVKYKNAIIEASLNYDIVIAEGLLSFYDPEIVQLFHKKIFINLSFTEFQRRKLSDLRWGKEAEWYILHIWNSYLNYGQSPFRDNHDTLILEGDLDFNIRKILHFIGI